MGTNTDKETIARERIIDAALHMISRYGSSNVTMEEIAREAGFSKGGVAHYFSSKDQLFETAYGAFFDLIFKRSKDTIESCKDPLAKVLSFDWLFNWDDPDVNTGYPLIFDCMMLAVHNEPYRLIFHEWVNGWIMLLRAAVEEGVREGLFRSVDPEATARSISAIYHGIAFRWYLDKGGHSTEWAIHSFQEAITYLVLSPAAKERWISEGKKRISRKKEGKRVPSAKS
jgi:AcrR family transcriptional regulator